MDGVDAAEDLHGSALIIGFGRFGQVASQSLLARGIDVSIIDTDTEMIRAAGRFGFKVYYGDGCRLDVLHAAGAGEAQGDPGLRRQARRRRPHRRAGQGRVPAGEAPGALLRPRARAQAGRRPASTCRSARPSSRRSNSARSALRELGVPEDEAAETAEDIRRRDAERFALETTGGLLAGRDLLHGNAPTPVPFTTPRRPRPAAEQPADGVEKSG